MASTTIPRLISVVEIVKREYLKSLPKARVRVGLWQYNELGCVEGPSSGSSTREDLMEEDGGEAAGIDKVEERANMIINALEGGKNQYVIFCHDILFCRTV